MIKMAQYFEEIGLHKSADVALKYAMKKESQTTGIAPVTIGDFFRNAQFGDYLSVIRSQLAPFVKESNLEDILKLIVNTPMQALYDKLRNIQYNPASQQKVQKFGPQKKNPFILTTGQDPNAISDVYKNRKMDQDLRVFLPVLTNWGLKLAKFYGLLSGAAKVTGLSPNVAQNPSIFPATYRVNDTVGAQFGLPSTTQTQTPNVQ